MQPFVSATLSYGVASCGGAVQLAMQVRDHLHRVHAAYVPRTSPHPPSCVRRPQGGMNAAVTMSEPAVTVSLFGSFGFSYTITIPGLDAAFPITWDMQLLAPFTFS